MQSNIKEGSFIKGKDGKEIFVYCWGSISESRAVIQIFHGMAEHAGRYKKFAEYLNAQGFIVYANDHRGHGRTAGSVEELGYIGKDGFNAIVEDEYIISKFIKEKYKNLPVIILGHSFGSFVAQEYIIRYGDKIKGVILSGSAARMGLDVRVGKLIASIEKSIFGDTKKSRVIDYLSFSGYNKKIKNNKYKFEWLSCDLEEVKKYEEDPLCGTVVTIGFFYWFFKGILELYKKERLIKIPNDLPILIVSGEEDPVGNYGHLVKKLYEIYKAIGIKNLDMELYVDRRHELIHEINRDEVFTDLLMWIDNCIKK